MAQQIENHIQNSAFHFDFQHIAYPEAGHLISGHPDFPATNRYGEMTIAGKTYLYPFGGSISGDTHAKKDAYQRVFEYLKQY